MGGQVREGHFRQRERLGPGPTMVSGPVQTEDSGDYCLAKMDVSWASRGKAKREKGTM